MTFEIADRYGHSPLVHAFVANQITLTGGTSIPVPFSSALKNEGGVFTFTPVPRFTANEAGRYFVNVSLGLENTTTTGAFSIFAVSVYSPGGVLINSFRPAGVAIHIPASNNGAFAGASGVVTVDLDYGGYLEFGIFCSQNARFFGGNPNGNWDFVQVFKLN